MTIFRVNIDRDEAQVVGIQKKLKKEDPEMAKLVGLYVDTQIALFTMMQKHAKPVIKVSRQLYTAADKRLKELNKDKKKNAEAIKEVTKLRKFAYETTMSLKTDY